MTRDEILALSGRELDAAVAEHVMGWTFTKGHCVACSCYYCGRHNDEDCDCEYSTDPVASAALWDKLIADGWCIQVISSARGNHVHLWRVATDIQTQRFDECGQTLCHALARAALLASTQEQNEKART